MAQLLAAARPMVAVVVAVGPQEYLPRKAGERFLVGREVPSARVSR